MTETIGFRTIDCATDLPFNEFLGAVNDLLTSWYGVETDDDELRHVTAAHNAGWTPRECAIDLVSKLSLDCADGLLM